MGIRTTRLPSEQLKHDLEFFKKSVADCSALKESIENVLENKDVVFHGDNPFLSDMKIKKLQVELNEVTGKLRIHGHNLEIYETRVDMYAPVLEKETKETNEGWDALWEEAVAIAMKFPQSAVALILNGYPKEQYDPELFSQEQKNESFKALRHQIKSYHQQIADGKKNKNQSRK